MIKMEQTKTEEQEREEFWKKVEDIQIEALEDHNRGVNGYDDLIFEVIEELGCSLSKRSVWERIRDLANEVLENANLEED